MIKLIKNSFLFIISRFLSSHEDKNNTYHILKNSDGCILGNHGRLIHHLAQFNSTPNHGINTDICNNIRTTHIITIILFF